MILNPIRMLIQRKKRKRFAFILPEPPRMEMQDIEKAAARLFSTEDGQKFLAYLQNTVFARAVAMEAPDSTLRYLEGQRALMATIIRLIERGRQA